LFRVQSKGSLSVKRLVCVSNRISVPGNGSGAGGLAVGLTAAMSRSGGLWFGWSGETSETPSPEPQVVTHGNIEYATIDLTPAQVEDYYNGYCNGTLWPLFHYFPDVFRHEQRHYEAYQVVNALFAKQLLKMLQPGDAVWVHDYHLSPMARYLHQYGFDGPIGFFLHTPFPHIQVLKLLPNYAEVVRDLCQYDVAGFQTGDDVQSFQSCVARGKCTTHVGAYPIGVDVRSIAEEAAEAVLEARPFASSHDSIGLRTSFVPMQPRFTPYQTPCFGPRQLA
jgi:trehalose 6-phosphate synthase